MRNIYQGENTKFNYLLGTKNKCQKTKTKIIILLETHH